MKNHPLSYSDYTAWIDAILENIFGPAMLAGDAWDDPFVVVSALNRV